MAILGKGPGATVTYQGPKREMSVTVVAVRLPD
jgi:transcription elongation GreA/GreB family factor